MAASKRPFSRDVEHSDDGGGGSRTVCVPIKRCRVDNCFSVTDHLYLDFPERLVDGMTNVLMNNLCGRYCGVLITLTPLMVINSNAADETSPIGYSFSKAYCSIGKYDSQYVFSSLFKSGIDILLDYVEQRKLPSNNEKKTVLDTLLHFIFNLTNATGNKRVWHGNVDIIVNDEVIVEVTEDICISPGGKSPVDVKLKTSSLSRNTQIIAQTIVFSFLKKKRHPERSNFLTPCIGVTGSDLVIYFYDSEHDILLESNAIPLFTPDSVTGGINLTAVVVTWLVVNHKYLCDGLNHVDDLKTKKSGFFDQVQTKLNVYENELQMGDVVPLTLNVLTSPAPKNLVFDATAVMANDRCLKIAIARNAPSKK
ncbi:uncharacterized protein [Argopecten irradians]|uniref:uncharacterized protein isoform X2 n=1 Tax=Argopecten irradians TaxID=31199 RepID=UPI0037106164